MTNDHIYTETDVFMFGMKIYDCKYCNRFSFKKSTGEYTLSDSIKCITGNEKIIKDLLE